MNRSSRLVSNMVSRNILATMITLVAAIILASWVVPQFSLRELLLFLIGVVLIGPLIHKAVKGQFDILEPLVWINGSFLIMFFARPIALIDSDSFVFRERYDISGTFDAALVVALAGCFGIQLGYCSGFPKRVAANTPPLPSTFHPSTSVLLSIGMIAIAIIVYWQTRVTGESASTAYIYLLPYLMAPACMILTHLGRFYRSTVLSVIAYLIIASYCLLLIPTGKRLTLMQIVMAFIILFMLRHHYRPRFIGVVVSLVAAFYLTTSLRDLTMGNDLFTAWGSIMTHVQDTSGSLQTFFTSNDTEMFDGLAQELTIVPESLKYQHGSSLYLLVTHIIPRSLWPDKPYGAEDLLNQQLFETDLGMAGVAYSILGGFYYDSGILGVIIGTFFLGLTFRFVWEYFRYNQNNDVVCMIYAASLPFTISIARGNLQYLLAVALFIVAPIVVVAWITGIRRPKYKSELKVQRNQLSHEGQ